MSLQAQSGIGVVIVAAGGGTRLGHPEPKAFVAVNEHSILVHALHSVLGMNEPCEIVVVAPTEFVTLATSQVQDAAGAAAAHITVVAGGDSRAHSVAAGLGALSPEVDIVLVHDAARALAPSTLFESVAAAVRASGNGIVPALPIVDTIKRVDPASGSIRETVDRSELAAVQTPQGFVRSKLDSAYAAASAAGTIESFTDDAALSQAAGFEVTTTAGSELAFKITTPWDLARAERLLAARTVEVLVPRVATGVDVHAFADDDATPLWLAGLHWPGERGLTGHSDGDAASHAICDALLAAAGLGDIGGIFGTADPRLAGAHGDVFLRETMRLITEAGFRVGNVAVQLVGNRPKLSPRRVEAEALLGQILGAPVSVTATTSDALGFLGRGEGVAAIATATILPLNVR